MNPIQTIESFLKQTQMRCRWQQAWLGCWRGLLVGSILGLIGLSIYKFAPVSDQFLSGVGIAFLVCPVMGFLWGFSRPRSLEQTARWVDQKQKLKERLSSALELNGKTQSTEWKELVLADAAKHAGELNPKSLVAFHLPRSIKWCALCLILSATLAFVPEYRSAKYLQAKKDAEVIRDIGKNLAQVTRRTIEQRRPIAEPARESLEKVQQLGEMLGKASLTKNEALKDISSVSEKLKEQMKEFGKDGALKRMQQAARTPGGQTTSGNAEMQKKMEELKKALGGKDTAPDALDKLREELQKVQKAAAGIPANDPAGADQAKQQLAQSMSDLAQKAQEMGLSLPNLDDAMKALEGSQIDKVLKDLKLADVDLQKLQAMSKALQQMQMQAANMGKDLPEQLKNGQAEAAKNTLEKMVEQLKKGDLTKEQLEKMIAEVSKAVKPAGEYGKVADFLKAASEQLQQGQKAEGAKSLADAANELKNLMNQMSDAQSMMAALDALQRGQMGIANGMCWGECQGNGKPNGPPRAGKGGKPGKGVGTWADENGWMQIPEMSELWDNSGLKRPDMAPKGHTDRGDGELADTIAPTKLKGQMNPGGPMPSISLKGLSIRGQSKVAYEEATAAAQSDAQAALSQEQVPRAYQGAVRDYFDDLKK